MPARKRRRPIRRQRSITLELAQDRWVVRRAEALSTTVTTVIRQLVMAAMAAEQAEQPKTNGEAA